MKIYNFPITLSGYGETPEEAWRDAIEGFTLDPGPTPIEGEYSVEEEND